MTEGNSPKVVQVGSVAARLASGPLWCWKAVVPRQNTRSEFVHAETLGSHSGFE